MFTELWHVSDHHGSPSIVLKLTHRGISSNSSCIAFFSLLKKFCVLRVFCFLLFSWVTFQLYSAQMNITPVRLRLSHDTIQPSKANARNAAKCLKNTFASSTPKIAMIKLCSTGRNRSLEDAGYKTIVGETRDKCVASSKQGLCANPCSKLWPTLSLQITFQPVIHNATQK